MADVTEVITYREAVAEGIARELRRDPSVVCLGEDIAAAGGVFKTTAGLLAEFGKERVWDTPISEQAILGVAMGAAMTGMRPVAEIMFSDFFACCWDYLANEIPKMRYMTGGQVTVPLVVRTANGGGHEPDDVGRRGRRRDLQPGDGQRPVLHRLGVLRAEAEAAAVRGPHHQRDGDLAPGHVAHLRDLIGQVVPAAGEEVGEHDLRHRAQAGHRRAHGRAQDGLLGDRGVPDALRAELLEQPRGRLEHAAGRADVFS